MKKLVAAGCCVLFLNNFSKVSTDSITEEKTNGQRTLVKALAAIINNEANKKLPAKRIFIAASEPPLF